MHWRNGRAVYPFVLLIGVAALSSILPALRLTHLDPAVTLRDE
jgi:ABC-type lipoprotein release transport system permease subunit